MAQLLPNGKQQFADANGLPLAAGTVDFYIPGTTVRKDTWQDFAQSALNTNPVQLDAAGRATIFGAGAYRQIVKDILGNTIWDQVTSGSGLNVFTTLAAFTASDVGSLFAQLVGVPGVPDGAFFYSTANAPYTADGLNVIKADSTALSVGAWVRQRADNIAAAIPASGAVTEALQGAVSRSGLNPESFGAVGYSTSAAALAGADSTTALQNMANAAATLGLAVNGNGRWYKVGTVSWPSGSYVQNLRCVVPNATTDNAPFFVDGQSASKSNITFVDCEVHGNRVGQTSITTSGGDGQRCGFKVYGRTNNIKLIRPKAWNCATEGIFVWTGSVVPASADDILHSATWVIDCDVRYSGRHGISFSSHTGTVISGGISTANGMDAAGWTPSGTYSDGGYARRTGGTLGGTLYGRPVTHEGFYLGEHYTDWTISNFDGRGNVAGPQFYAVMFPTKRSHKNLRIVGSQFDDPNGGSGDGSLILYSVICATNDGTGARTTYTGTDAFDGIAVEGSTFGRNYINISCAQNVSIKARADITTGTYSAIYTNCANVLVSDIKSTRTQLGRPSMIASVTPTYPSGWSASNTPSLSVTKDMPGGRYLFSYAFSANVTATGSQKITLTVPSGLSLSPHAAAALNNSTGGPVTVAALPGGNQVNDIDIWVTSPGVTVLAFYLTFEAERTS